MPSPRNLFSGNPLIHKFGEFCEFGDRKLVEPAEEPAGLQETEIDE